MGQRLTKQNLGNFGNFLRYIFKKKTVSIEKCLSVQSTFSVSLVGWFFFWQKKKRMLDLKIFTFFKPKNDLFQCGWIWWGGSDPPAPILKPPSFYQVFFSPAKISFKLSGVFQPKKSWAARSRSPDPLPPPLADLLFNHTGKAGVNRGKIGVK